MSEDIIVRCAPLPGSIRGFTCKKNDLYIIIIREDLDDTQRLNTYEHELNHILNGDYDSGISADMIEVISHR